MHDSYDLRFYISSSTNVPLLGELEIMAARSSAGDVFEERREEVWGPSTPGTRPPSAPAPIINIPPPPPPAPVYINTAPPQPAEFIQESETIIKEGSERGSSQSSHSHHHHHHDHSRTIPIGPFALAERSRSRSRSGREIRSEIRALERELVHRPRDRDVSEREVVKAERLPDGQLVVYEEEVDNFVSHPKPPRIEKDKKGRMSISVPKYR